MQSYFIGSKVHETLEFAWILNKMSLYWEKILSSDSFHNTMQCFTTLYNERIKIEKNEH